MFLFKIILFLAKLILYYAIALFSSFWRMLSFLFSLWYIPKLSVYIYVGIWVVWLYITSPDDVLFDHPIFTDYPIHFIVAYFVVMILLIVFLYSKIKNIRVKFNLFISTIPSLFNNPPKIQFSPSPALMQSNYEEKKQNKADFKKAMKEKNRAK